MLARNVTEALLIELVLLFLAESAPLGCEVSLVREAERPVVNSDVGIPSVTIDRVVVTHGHEPILLLRDVGLRPASELVVEVDSTVFLNCWVAHSLNSYLDTVVACL